MVKMDELRNQLEEVEKPLTALKKALKGATLKQAQKPLVERQEKLITNLKGPVPQHRREKSKSAE